MLLAIAITYVLVYGSQNIVSGPNVSIDVALAKRDLYGSDFLWFQKEGRQYLIRDSATLERIEKMFDDARVLKPEMKKLKWELRSLERRESELDRQIDALSDTPHRTAEEDDRLRELRAEMRDLRNELRPRERRQEEIERKRDALEAEAERQLVPILEDAIRSGVATPVR